MQHLYNSGKNITLLALIALLSFSSTWAQPSINWQKNFGTAADDEALQLFHDRSGNLIVMGREPHVDFTGNWRTYMYMTKLDPGGNEIWKHYHDVAIETYNPPVEYYFGSHFFTEEFGESLINVVMSINNRTMLYKVQEGTGQFYSAEEITSPVLDVAPNNDKTYADVLCSSNISCYGPDSLIVQRFDPTPDSIFFDPVKWTYETKQNFRTAPIQGHYDFNLEEICTDSLGNTYLLVQIERWDFQFCTDCADAFIDAWCEVFKINSDGELVSHKRIFTSKAVVSFMRFIRFDQDEMVIRIDDINAAGTAVVTSVYRVDSDLNVDSHFTLNKQYHYIRQDADGNFIGVTNVYDPNNPELIGLTDVLVAKFNAQGVEQWKKYFGGTGYDFARGMVLTEDGLVFLSSTDSDDVDVEDNQGFTDAWVVDLSFEPLANEDPQTYELAVFPNPAKDWIHVSDINGKSKVWIVDLTGRMIAEQDVDDSSNRIDIAGLLPGIYFLQITDAKGKQFSGKFTKQY